MTSWQVGMLPFVFSIQKQPGNSGFPEFLPFTLGMDSRDGTFIQIFDPAIEMVLKRAYASGSMLSGLMDEGGIGQRYAEDYLNFIGQTVPPLKGKRVLDIGCGTGYLLSRMKKLGAEVIGLEPGMHGAEGARRHQVPIIRDYFPSHQVGGRFDLISAFGLLEHIVDPERVLLKMKGQLAEDGWLVLGVPDCEPYLTAGDISLFFHEHWNYFTRRSITSLVGRVFGGAVAVKRAGFGGSLYVAVQNTKASAGPPGEGGGREAAVSGEFCEYVALAKRRIQCFWSRMEEAWANGEMVGIYVPWRAVNILALRPNRIPQGGLRFFDDNPLLHGTYYPGFPIPVESRQQLVSNPPDRLFIMSNTFSSEIERQLRSANLTMPMHTWEQLFGM